MLSQVFVCCLVDICYSEACLDEIWLRLKILLPGLGDQGRVLKSLGFDISCMQDAPVRQSDRKWHGRGRQTGLRGVSGGSV